MLLVGIFFTALQLIANAPETLKNSSLQNGESLCYTGKWFAFEGLAHFPPPPFKRRHHFSLGLIRYDYLRWEVCAVMGTLSWSSMCLFLYHVPKITVSTIYCVYTYAVSLCPGEELSSHLIRRWVQGPMIDCLNLSLSNFFKGMCS